MGHPDFRVAGKIFAPLAWPANGWSMVKLTPEQQAMFVRAQPGAFVPVKGAWGRRGATNVRLSKAKAARRARRAHCRLAQHGPENGSSQR